jgi:hypothetical protein
VALDSQALELAAAQASASTVRILLGAKASVEGAEGASALALAVRSASVESVRALLEAKVGTPSSRHKRLLYEAAKAGSAPVMRCLLQAMTANATATTATDGGGGGGGRGAAAAAAAAAAGPGFVDVDGATAPPAGPFASSHADNDTPLGYAAGSGRADLVRLLLGAKAKVDALCPFRVPVALSHVEYVALLLLGFCPSSLSLANRTQVAVLCPEGSCRGGKKTHKCCAHARSMVTSVFVSVLVLCVR